MFYLACVGARHKLWPEPRVWGQSWASMALGVRGGRRPRHTSIWLSSLWGEGRTWQPELAVLTPPRDLRPALGPCSPPPTVTHPHAHCSPRELAHRAEDQTYLGAALWGDPHSKKFGVSSLSLFPYLGGERQPSTVPGARPPAPSLPLGSMLPGAQGPGLVSREVLLSQECGTGGAGTSHPLIHTWTRSAC